MPPPPPPPPNNHECAHRLHHKLVPTHRFESDLELASSTRVTRCRSAPPKAKPGGWERRASIFWSEKDRCLGRIQEIEAAPPFRIPFLETSLIERYCNPARGHPGAVQQCDAQPGSGEHAGADGLARGGVPGSELVVWADTITAALRAFSGAGGSPAPSRPSTSVGSSSRSPTAAAESPAPAMPTRTPAAAAAATTTLANPRSTHRTRNSSNRASTLPAPRCPHHPIFGRVGERMTLELRPHGLFDDGLIEMLPVPGSGTWTGDYDPSVVSSYDIRLSFPGLALVALDRFTYSSVPHEKLSSTKLASGDVITLTTSGQVAAPAPTAPAAARAVWAREAFTRCCRMASIIVRGRE
ncbi:uncharacterized protein LAJ45_06398 [Morchella importuna]|uniref:uncharacterized protein n=1 Tax=Morchella importuna TaxID=1174673 RepID=UPI001E8DADAA|nr:uncharacterized protein LAJ45_06398 [Morchella importuna]KAH8149767.1 hypothetical protein LAJ45_06398 [Morchella importuna]